MTTECGCGRQRTITNQLDGPGYSLICMEVPSNDENYWLGANPVMDISWLDSLITAEEWAEDHLSYCNCSRYM